MAGDRYDVAIVGGSLAGCATATFLGRAGLKVALLERHTDPACYKHLCTTAIQAGAVPTIQRLGLDGPIEAAGGIRTHLALWNRWGWTRDLTATDYGYGIRRETLDPLLRGIATSTPGVDYLPGHTVRSLTWDGDRVAGLVADRADGSSTEIRARLVVGADGRSSEVAKLAGVGAREIRKHQRSGYFAWFRNVDVPHPGHAHLWMLEPDTAYAFPQDGGLTILAVMFGRERAAAFKTDVQGNFLTMLRSVPEYARFDPSDQVGKVLGLVDYANHWRRRPPPGLAFVGDAAIAPDPLFGVGCGWALQEAEWLADATASAFGSDRDLDRAVRRYRATLRSKLAGHYFLIADYSTGRGFNPAEKLLFSSAAKDPRAAHLASQIGARSAPAQNLLTPRALAHGLRVNLSPAGRGVSATAKRNRTLLRQRATSPTSVGAADPVEAAARR